MNPRIVWSNRRVLMLKGAERIARFFEGPPQPARLRDITVSEFKMLLQDVLSKSNHQPEDDHRRPNIH